MKGSTIRGPLRKQGLYLGTMAEQAAVAHGSTLLTLDHDLDMLPEAGRRLTVSELAYHVDELAGRLSAAGVRSRERVAIYKTANFDAAMLTMAVSRIGAVPVTLSPALSGETVGTLLGRLDRPHVITDAAKLEVLADVPLKNITRLVLNTTGPAPEPSRCPTWPARRVPRRSSWTWTRRR